MHGVLVIDKPQGPTSFEVVRRVRSTLGLKRAGHTGTLDPMATGVLAVCLGEATKLAGLLTEGDKAYDAVVRLGVRTDTQDVTGTVLETRPVPPLSAELLESALGRFRGSFLQLPPMFSAVKVKGKRLYEHARAGESVERAPRQVTVHSLVLRDFSASECTLSLRCSKGFFVRSLADALGEALGCGGALRSLRRTQSGPFGLDRAIPLSQVEALGVAGPSSRAQLEGRIIPMADALPELPIVQVSEQDVPRVLHGVALVLGPEAPLGRVRVLGPDRQLLAVAEVHEGRLSYVRVVVPR
ncbi:MAG TPA: tRNA pseudouridine(55) synthase TruB [Myxococcaceae bacterium]|nr:tRNA pseudouridine(55) synthase TruB [Myxococcaceae bacterium]